jgi:polyisoprenoid-binding protein YceI
MADALTRTHEGLDVPAAGTFEVDVAHTHVGFSVRHMMVSKVRGGFTSFTGTVRVADDPLQSVVELSIDAASIDTHDETRDTHLRSPDFLDVATYPTLTYRSTGLTPEGHGRFKLHGELTVRDITRPVDLDVSFEGVARDPWGNQRFGISATGEVDREDFGLTWNQALETGGVLVGKAVKFEIEAEAVRKD